MRRQKFVAVKLHFHTPLHLSRGMSSYESGFEIIHSDSLKSAIFACGIQLYGDKDVNLDFLKSFRLTSAFPFDGDEYFFPLPEGKANIELTQQSGELSIGAMKKIKGLQYLGKKHFEALLDKGVLKINEESLSKAGNYFSENLPQSNILFSKALQQRVTIPPWGSEDPSPTPFYLERYYFSEGKGLFFLIESEDADVLHKLDRILHLLGDNGIGTDRSVGNGLFSHTLEKDFHIEVPEQGKQLISLSLFCPQQGEINEPFLEASSYRILKRGGYIASPENMDCLTYRKKSVYMFSEGSIFPNSGKKLEGKVVNLKPEKLPENLPEVAHPVWRDGQAIFLPMNAS